MKQNLHNLDPDAVAEGEEVDAVTNGMADVKVDDKPQNGETHGEGDPPASASKKKRNRKKGGGGRHIT